MIAINWRPTASELRRFGVGMLVIFAVFGLAKLYWPWSWGVTRDPRLGVIFLAIAAVVGALGMTGTKIALPIYWFWMGLAFVLGSVMSRVLLGLIFFLVVTPTGLLARLVGRDRLQLKKPKGSSYWRDLPTKAAAPDYERQF